jgi:hypothetical protein
MLQRDREKEREREREEIEIEWGKKRVLEVLYSDRSANGVNVYVVVRNSMRSVNRTSCF